TKKGKTAMSREVWNICMYLGGNDNNYCVASLYISYFSYMHDPGFLFQFLTLVLKLAPQIDHANCAKELLGDTTNILFHKTTIFVTFFCILCSSLCSVSKEWIMACLYFIYWTML
ncbi:hypothetical protein ACJX0J_010517, partial [Zea mays]